VTVEGEVSTLQGGPPETPRLEAAQAGHSTQYTAGTDPNDRAENQSVGAPIIEAEMRKLTTDAGRVPRTSKTPAPNDDDRTAVDRDARLPARPADILDRQPFMNAFGQKPRVRDDL